VDLSKYRYRKCSDDDTEIEVNTTKTILQIEGKVVSTGQEALKRLEMEIEIE
jgi:hypothetical protein